MLSVIYDLLVYYEILKYTASLFSSGGRGLYMFGRGGSL